MAQNILSLDEDFRDVSGDRGYVPWVGAVTGELYFLDTAHILFERHLEEDPYAVIFGEQVALYDMITDGHWRATGHFSGFTEEDRA